MNSGEDGARVDTLVDPKGQDLSGKSRREARRTEPDELLEARNDSQESGLDVEVPDFSKTLPRQPNARITVNLKDRKNKLRPQKIQSFRTVIKNPKLPLHQRGVTVTQEEKTSNPIFQFNQAKGLVIKPQLMELIEEDEQPAMMSPTASQPPNQ